MSSSKIIKQRTSVSSFEDMTFFYNYFLKLSCILPLNSLNFSHPLSRLHLVYCFLWSTFYSTSYVFFTIDEIRRKIPSTDTLCETVLIVGVIIRYYMLIQNRSEFTKLFEECRGIWNEYNEDGHRVIRQFESKIRFVFKLLFAVTFVTIVVYIISAVVMTINSSFHNDTNSRFLPLKWYTQDGAYLWPGYKITFVLQVILMNTATVIVSSVDAAGPYLIVVAAGYFRALRHRFLLIDDDDHFELVACTRLHQRILDFCSRIDMITRSLFFIQLMTTVYNISFLSIKIVGSDPDTLKYIPFILMMLSQFFVCQWAPDQLIGESSAISFAAYSVSFNRMKDRIGKILIVIIARSQRPVRMTAAGFVHLSLENFGSMLTSAISFFTVLRNFNI